MRKQERCNIGYFRRFGDPSERNPLHQLLSPSLAKPRGHIGCDEPRGKHVDTKPAATHLFGEAADHPLQSGLGRCVVCLTGIPHLTDNGTDADDRTLLRADQRSQKRVDAQVGPLQIDIKHIVPRRLLEPQHQLILCDSRVANEQIDVSFLFYDALRSGGDTRLTRHIHACVMTRGQRRSKGGSGFLVPCPDPRCASLGAEPFYDRFSDSSGTACDNGDTVFEFAHSFASS